jgi:hypothetical protein
LGGRGRRISEFEDSLVYKVSSRTARAIQRNPVSKNQKKKKPKTKNKTKTKNKNKTDCFSRSPEFNSQQPHSGSQPSIMRYDALYWSI